MLGRAARERGVDVVAPKLEAQGADVRGGDGVCYTRNFEIEGSDGEVGGLGMGWDEGAEGGGWGVVLPLLVFSDAKVCEGTARKEGGVCLL